MEIPEVELLPVESDRPEGELAAKVHYECEFCGKTMGLYPEFRRLYEKLSGDQFFCPFCLRHYYNTRINRHVLPISFRAIIGYYYYGLYEEPSSRTLSYSEIEECIQAHQRVGLLNPVFCYDPESYLWFINFTKVGKHRKDIGLEEVQRTIVNILACFNLFEHLRGVSMNLFYKKYEEAVHKFYTLRTRPNGRKLCIPTLHGCGVVERSKSFTFEDTRQFISQDFVLR